MNPSEIHKIKVAILDDSTFYTSILKRQVSNTLDHIAEEKPIVYELNAYTYARDFMNNSPKENDIVLLDYFLGDGVDAGMVLDQIDPYKNNIKVAMISQYENFYTVRNTLAKGAITFINKDKDMLIHARDFIEHVIRSYY
ncbi:MAG: hypothetical protein H6598_06390 [Flavobacteriales bacterium]|nr:hypothetical protein [Flavobacteriales bacterium]